MPMGYDELLAKVADVEKNNRILAIECGEALARVAELESKHRDVVDMSSRCFEAEAKVAEFENSQGATMLLIKHAGWDGKGGFDSAIDWVVTRVAELEGAIGNHLEYQGVCSSVDCDTDIVYCEDSECTYCKLVELIDKFTRTPTPEGGEKAGE